MTDGNFLAFSRVDRQYNIYPRLGVQSTEGDVNWKNVAMPGLGVSQWDWDAGRGIPEVLELPAPEVNSITVSGNSIAINATFEGKLIDGTTDDLTMFPNGKDDLEYKGDPFIDWYADGVLIHRGNTLDLYANQLQLYHYVRATIVTKYGVIYTQPFTIEEDLPIDYKIGLSQVNPHDFLANIGYTELPEELTVTVSNQGAMATGALTIELSGDDKDKFDLNTGGLASIPAMGSDTFTVQPNELGLALGTYTATVTVTGGNGIEEKFDVRFIVGKKTGSGTVGIAGWTYGEDANDPIANSDTNGNEAITITYKVKGALDSTYTTTVPTKAGDYTVRAVFGQTDEYLAHTATADFTIAKKQLTWSAGAVSNKTYDRTTNATITTQTTLQGIVDDDEINMTTGTVVFSNMNVGNNRTFTVGGYGVAATGDWADGNYLAPAGQPFFGTANITRRAITITGVQATGRVYDRTRTVALTGGTLNGVLSGDTVNFTRGTGTVASANFGNNKLVTTKITLTGAHAANYTLTQPTTVRVNITRQKLRTPSNLRLTATRANWSNVPNNNGYTLVVRRGSTTVLTKQISRNATSYTFTAAERNRMRTRGTYTYTLLAKGTGNYSNSNRATSSGTNGRFVVR
jgi:hypothetical protein